MSVLQEAAALARDGESFALATVVWRQGPSSGRQGSRAIITADGELRGWIGGACAEPVVIREARQVIADGRARLLLLGTPEQFGPVHQSGAVADGMTVVPISCQSEGALQVYIEPVLPAPHLVIVGGSPMTRVLATMAGTLGWDAELVAGRDFAGFAAAGHVTGRSMVIVATQGHDDEEITEAAIAARPAYLGLVGSRKRGEAVLGYLADRGVPSADTDRVRVPAGLDLGSTSHEEMAVAILGELVRLRASGALASGALATGEFNRETSTRYPERMGPTAVGTAASSSSGGGAGGAGASGAGGVSAVDPVCGMTVPADESAHPFAHDGVTYYFCCAGCRRTFEKDPGAHLEKEAAR